MVPVFKTLNSKNYDCNGNRGESGRSLQNVIVDLVHGGFLEAIKGEQIVQTDYCDQYQRDKHDYYDRPVPE